MAPIKLRAWDPKNKKMFTVARYDFADNTVYSHLFNCKGYLAENLNIMQFTGLLDIKGLDIYESQKVKDTFDNIFIIEHGEFLNYDIEDNESYYEFGFYLKDLETGFSFPLCKREKLEIIGNIYQKRTEE